MRESGSAKSWRGAKVFTIGHSTHTLDELVAMLRGFEVSVLVDIRTIPRSRHNPQFNLDELRSSLRSRRIRYVHLAELGGLRKTHKDSPNTGWRNASFRGFADYMLSEEFEVGLAKLRALAQGGQIAIMCAEAVPWRCHRSLVADALTARGAHVEHISSATHASPHHLTRFARVHGTEVTYPGQDAEDTPLATRAPFHLEATVRALQRRAENLVDLWDDDRYLRVLRTEDGLALVEVENHGTIDEPDVRFIVRHGALSPATHAGLGETVRRMLGLDVDPKPLQALAERERRLRPTALALRGMRPPRFSCLFESFANVVPFQQVSLDAGVANVRRLVERFGEPLDLDGRRFYAFPTAPVIAGTRATELKACGLSLRKAETLCRLAAAIERGELTEEKLAHLDSGEAERLLQEQKGIGPWSSNLVLLRGLGRLDVFPPGDVGAAHGLGSLLHLEPGPPLERVIQRFGDFRGYLYFCSLGSSLLARGLIHPAPLVAAARTLTRGAAPSSRAGSAGPPRRRAGTPSRSPRDRHA